MARLRTNESEVFAALDSYVSDVRSVAGVRAVNKLGQQAGTAMFREISSLYGIGPRVTERYASVKLASIGDKSPEFVLTVKGKGFPLSVLNPIKTRKGVSVRIKGRRHNIPHLFLVTLRSGHVAVMARGAYGGKGAVTQTGESFGRFRFGRARLPINEIFTFSPPQTLANEQVQKAGRDRVAEQQSKVFAQEIRFATRGGSR